MRSFYARESGKVICTAIDKYVYAIIKERFDDMIYINYSRKECVASVDDIEHDLVREAMRLTGVTHGVEITTLADIPSSGSGLGSSSSITVALLHALYTYRGELITAERLAREACRIEIDILGKPIGKQDQYAAAYGGVNRFVFQADEEVVRIPVTLAPSVRRRFAASLLLYYTGITRRADDILSRQNANMDLDAKFGKMSQMVALVEPFTEAMTGADVEECGRLLENNWVLKQQMASGISNPQIDDMYSCAIESGALAGKVAGAGGGGFLLLIAQREQQNRVFEAMTAYRELPFMLESGGSKVIFDDRSYTDR